MGDNEQIGVEIYACIDIPICKFGVEMLFDHVVEDGVQCEYIWVGLQILGRTF